MKKLKAGIFVYLIRPLMNRYGVAEIVDCPMCGDLLQKYDDYGYLHLIDGDADCFGALGYGKGNHCG